MYKVSTLCLDDQQSILGETTSFLDHVYLGCTQRECETSKDIVENYRNMCESRISARAKEKLPCSGRPDANNSTWSSDMEGHAKICVKRVATPCLDDNQFKEEQIGSFGDLPKVCFQIVLKFMYLARIGRPDILWPVNKLARAVTKWTRACDTRLARLISYFHHTNEFKQKCHVGNTAQQCRLGLFQDSDFAGGLEDSKSTLRRIFVHIWKTHFCSHMLDVQETNFCFTQFDGIRDDLS